MSLQQITTHDGITLTGKRTGSGPPVLLLHGSGGGLQSWNAVSELLATDHHVWTFARRGYRPSDSPPGRTSFDDQVADVGTVLDLMPDAPHLVGASYGALVALHVGRDLPGRTRSITCWEPPSYAAGSQVQPVLTDYRDLLDRGNFPAAAALLAEKVARIPAAVREAMTPAVPVVPDNEVAGRAAVDGDAVARARGWIGDLESLADVDPAVEQWRGLSAPMLLLQGGDTWPPMPRSMDLLARQLPHARRHAIPHQTHFAPSAAPGEFVRVLIQFWANDVRRPGRGADAGSAGIGRTNGS